MSENAGKLQVEGRAGGPLATNTYRLLDESTGAWALVDASYGILDTWRDRIDGDEPPSGILLTHGHFDHVGGLAELCRRFPDAPVWVHPDSAGYLADGNLNGAFAAMLEHEPAEATHWFQGGDTFRLGDCDLAVIDAPGHCPGSVMLLCGKHLIAGDVVFQGSVGRWDLPGADYDTLAEAIRERVMTLPDETIVYPGHGPVTTVGIERQTNFIVHKMLAGERFD